jgi:hypothetical protein
MNYLYRYKYLINIYSIILNIIINNRLFLIFFAEFIKII